MKLTKITDGRWLVEIDDDVLVLSGFELAQLADMVGGQADQSELVRLEAEAVKLRKELTQLRTRVRDLEDSRRMVAELWDRDLSDGNDQQITDDLYAALNGILRVVVMTDR